jgi:hypothetical protein
MADRPEAFPEEFLAARPAAGVLDLQTLEAEKGRVVCLADILVALQTTVARAAIAQVDIAPARAAPHIGRRFTDS